MFMRRLTTAHRNEIPQGERSKPVDGQGKEAKAWLEK